MKLTQSELEDQDLLRNERKMNKLSIWEVISENKSLTPELIRHFRDKPFNWKKISPPNITLEFVRELIDMPWNWSWMSGNKTLTPELIRHFRDNWDYSFGWVKLSEHENITWGLVLELIDKPWNWSYLSRHKIVTWEMIRENPKSDGIIVRSLKIQISTGR